MRHYTEYGLAAALLRDAAAAAAREKPKPRALVQVLAAAADACAAVGPGDVAAAAAARDKVAALAGAYKPPEPGPAAAALADALFLTAVADDKKVRLLVARAGCPFLDGPARQSCLAALAVCLGATGADRLAALAVRARAGT